MLLETLGENILISPWILKMSLQTTQKLDLCVEKTVVIHFQLNNRSVSLREKYWKIRQELSFKILHQLYSTDLFQQT